MREYIRRDTVAWTRLREEFIEAQDGCCAICDRKLVRPQLDHCHITGFVRGVLCSSCNVKLGWFEGRRDRIERYLATAAWFAAHGEYVKLRAG